MGEVHPLAVIQEDIRVFLYEFSQIFPGDFRDVVENLSFSFSPSNNAFLRANVHFFFFFFPWAVTLAAAQPEDHLLNCLPPLDTLLWGASFIDRTIANHTGYYS